MNTSPGELHCMASSCPKFDSMCALKYVYMHVRTCNSIYMYIESLGTLYVTVYA